MAGQAQVNGSYQPTPNQPVVARMYDWYLGGTHNSEADRVAAVDVQNALPDIKPIAIENRSFLRRAVRWLAKNGVNQFVDIGSGLPTAMNTHEAVLKVKPNARILYVDIEETVVREGNEIIRKAGWHEQVSMIRASALEPETIFNNPEARRIIDFDQPVAILLIALIHFFETAQYEPVLSFWQSKIVKGSAFVMTHCSGDFRTPEAVRATIDVYARTPTPIIFRSREECLKIMGGWELVDPGLSQPELWRMEELDEREEEPPISNIWWVAVGRLV
ncbi:DUF574-domain-containing protein [Polyplosphaeria fusca]|uniref:DUF574-domain-containing protein n=1 Tax=Polyplosphaeria fusca TaxID=682080 RepID=A0A9P4R687_9PLEO|nr:DUF574-domain-containing protein [Polyplosphaeria fusca]